MFRVEDTTTNTEALEAYSKPAKLLGVELGVRVREFSTQTFSALRQQIGVDGIEIQIDTPRLTAQRIGIIVALGLDLGNAQATGMPLEQFPLISKETRCLDNDQPSQTSTTPRIYIQVAAPRNERSVERWMEYFEATRLPSLIHFLRQKTQAARC